MGVIEVDFISVPKYEIEIDDVHLQEKIKQLTERQTQYETIIHNQK